jgi:hypothetical protein
VSDAVAARRERGGLRLEDHLDAIRPEDLADVWSFWSGGDAPELPRREVVRQLAEVMADESTVYRRVRTLTRKVLDVLLVVLKRADYRSDLPGLFRRVPGEEPLSLEYGEAEGALKALVRRGFLAETVDRSGSVQGRAVYAAPLELGDLLSNLFREESRSVRSVFSLAGWAGSLGATARRSLSARFPGLALEPTAQDAAVLLSPAGPGARLEALDPPPLRALVARALDAGGILLRADATAAESAAWERRASARRLETAGLGTVARLSLGDYGLSCDDEALVVFHEVVEDVLRRRSTAEPDADEVVRPGGDLVADLSSFLGEVARGPVRVTREGDVHKAAQRRIEDGFVFRASPLASRADVWTMIRAAADRLGLVHVDAEGFLAVRDEADRFGALPLDAQVSSLYRLALDAPGPRGRSLHLCEMRRIVGELLAEDPSRWWPDDSLFVVARLRYLATLDARRIRDRHRDRHFSAFDAVRETLPQLLADLAGSWKRSLHLLGVVDVAARDGRAVAVRLSPLGARLLGVAAVDDAAGRPLLVTPDFEVVVLPEGDVADCVHRLGAFAQRERSGDVVHFRFTKASIEAAAAAGRDVKELLAWLAERARGPVPKNVATTLVDWAAGVAFGTLERGVVLRVEKPQALDAVLAVEGVRALLVRRLSPTEALLRDEIRDRRVLAAVRAEGVVLEGP